MYTRWSGIFLGMVTCVAVLMMLSLFGVGIGLIAFPFESVSEGWRWIGFSVSSAIYLTLATVIAFFAGGLIASRAVALTQKKEICFQALGMWGVTSLFILFVEGIAVSSLAPSAGAGVGAVAVLESLHKTKPKIVTDLSLIKGKAVTTIDAGVPDATLPNAQEIAEIARKATAGISLSVASMLLVSLFSSSFGAFFKRCSVAQREFSTGNILQSLSTSKAS